MKTCQVCELQKENGFFHKDKKTKDGFMSICKECRKINTKKLYKFNKQKNQEMTDIFVGMKICSTCRVEKNKTEFHKQIGKNDGLRSECKECRNIRWKKNYNKICIEHRKKNEKWRKNNKEKYNSFFKKYFKEKKEMYAWRTLLSSCLRRMGKKKENETIELLGYSFSDLKEDMERKFKDGMSWDNWGEWHIDHIIPISFFDKEEHPSVVNSLSNLQPLWKKENILKSNKFI